MDPGLTLQVKFIGLSHLHNQNSSLVSKGQIIARVNNKLSTRRDIRTPTTQPYMRIRLTHKRQRATEGAQTRATAYDDRRKIRVNAEKSEAIVFTRRFTENRILTLISLGGRQIPTKRCVKYLRVRLNQRLTFNNHINETVRSVYSMSRGLYSLLVRGSRLNRRNKRLLYTMIVRPAITYAAPVWCSIPTTTMKKLKILEHKFIRLASNSDRYTSLREIYTHVV